MPIISLLLRYKKYILGLLVIVAVVIYLIFFTTETTIDKPTTPPVVSKTEGLSVVNTTPVGNIESLDVLYPIAVEFNTDLDGNADGIVVTTVPSIRLKKYVLSSNPKTLWIEPAVTQSKDVQGWLDGVEYTITVARGSKSLSGLVLENNYSFKFRNSSENTYMMVD